MNYNQVPLMFQAQVKGRCQLHFVEGKQSRQQSHQWVEEWIEGFPKTTPPKPKTNHQASAPTQNKAWARPTTKDTLRPQHNKSISQNDPSKQIPQFGPGVCCKHYTVSWRFVSNSGQDDSIIRPVIGAKGWPFYPGSSMKGAFLRACRKLHGSKQAQRYCGKESLPSKDSSKDSSNPGILRFHGAYPVDRSWTNNLVDIVHCQWERQVIQESKENKASANAQISLYQPTLCFGISSTTLKKDDPEWQKIWQIWEVALAEGIGSRVSAGYGQFQEVAKDNQLLKVKLKGWGIASTLLDKTPEFRPNMFKAALRGHTLRLLGGLTDKNTAQTLTKQFWGGFEGKNSIIGLLGVAFECLDKDLDTEQEHLYKPKDKFIPMPLYELKKGELSIVARHRQLTEKKKQKLQTLAAALIKFSLLLGGFGKSWRRVDHSIFYPEYLDNSSKPMIGCHWEFIDKSESLYIPVNTSNLQEITQFLKEIRQIILAWVPSDKQVSQGIQAWREAWYPQKVQVWGRISTDGKSLAIEWFHQKGSAVNAIKNTQLTGGLGQIGRIWHRMYPRYITDKEDRIKATGEYIELLTIFPDASRKTRDFLQFLDRDQNFIRL